mgnify:CR=1 FL=1
MAATFVPLWLVWGRRLTASPEAQARIMAMNERESLQRPRLLKKSLAVLAAVLAGFTVAHPFGIQTATVALTGAVSAAHATDEVQLSPTCQATGVPCQLLLGNAATSTTEFSLTDTELDLISTAGKLYLGDRGTTRVDYSSFRE